jgi:hypothetical protein
VPGVAPSEGGDGLGPLFNEQSCVGCHRQGGIGGAGDNTNSTTILSAVPGVSVSGNRRSIFQGELEELHAGLRNRTSIVLHERATTKEDEARLAAIRAYRFVQSRDELFALCESKRSTPALFGASQFDGISDAALLEAEKRSFPDFPEITGRVSRLRDGRLGKFGWKGQTASLMDFVLASCANELGLEVLGHHQPSLRPAKDFDPKTLSPDLSDEQSALLVRFVESLPAPVFRRVGNADWGLLVFKKHRLRDLSHSEPGTCPWSVQRLTPP